MGPDRKGFRRLLHPNGVCLTGRWRITEESPYSGYFSRGSDALVVARYSSGASGNRRGQIRSLALVGKLFPTTDPDHATPLRTANFITQEDIGGARTTSINDAVLRNAPDVTVFRRGPAGSLLMRVASVFRRVDQEPTIRQVYQIAELGKPSSSPHGRRRSCSSCGSPASGDSGRRSRLPRRDDGAIFDRGDPAPKRTLTFTINVTDEGTTRGTPFRVRRTFANWRQIGELTSTMRWPHSTGDAVSTSLIRPGGGIATILQPPRGERY